MSSLISEFFEKDHREIDALLAGAPEALERFREFDRRLERHIRWEEELLFPAVALKAPDLQMGPMRVMAMEHEMIRENKANALRALERGDAEQAAGFARAMLRVLAEHNMKEEGILYPACDQSLSEAESEALLARIRAPAPRR